MSYRNSNPFKKKKSKYINNSNKIQSFLKQNNLNPKKIKDLKYLLSLTINPETKKFTDYINLKQLLIFLFNYLNPNTESLFTELFFQSCELSSLSIIQVLLEKDIDINSRNELGETPLHIAIAKNDIELIKLLIEYNPKTNIGTYKDNLTAVNYAEIYGDKNIIKMIKTLNEKYKKKEIKNEIKDCINNNMENLLINNDITNFEQIQDFNGEKITIVTDSDINNSNFTNNFNKNTNNSINENKYYITQRTIINESDYNEDINPSNEQKNIFNNNKAVKQSLLSDIKSNKNSNTNLKKRNIKEIKCFSSSLKTKSITNNLSINPSYIQSLTTCHTTNKDNKDLYNSLKISKIYEFISEINLPKEYANNLIESGFDNLDILIYQAKNGIALTYENLKDIGIKKPGERIKILVHLEEIAENFNYFIPKKIYFDDFEIQNKTNSLKIFLEKIGMDHYINNFFENGIYNIELLYIQIGTKQSLSERILIKDLGINKNDADNIIIKLFEKAKNYISNIKINNRRNSKKDINNKFIMYEGSNNNKYCEICNLF